MSKKDESFCSSPESVPPPSRGGSNARGASKTLGKAGNGAQMREQEKKT